MRLIDRFKTRPDKTRSDNTSGFLGDLGLFAFGGHQYQLGLNQTLSSHVEQINPGLEGYMAAVRQSPPVFGAQLVRSLILSQARFTWRVRRGQQDAGRTFGTNDLRMLERPWPKGTSGELLSKMEWHAGLAGNSFTHRTPDRLRQLRPDWTTLVWGSEEEPAEDAAWAADAKLLGIIYSIGGISAGKKKSRTILAEQVAHWSPLPDPVAPSLGMSWITPAIRDIQGDIAAAEHKVQFFANGATPNLVVKNLPAKNETEFNAMVDMIEGEHTGLRNAYRTLYLSGGADATVVGADMKQIDFKATQGTGETRISVLSRVPAAVLGISEGLAGSSLNAGNFGAARRLMADGWLTPTLQSACAALEQIVPAPDERSELWHDTTDMPFLREDARDAAEIQSTNAQTIRQFIDAGFTPESAAAAVQAQDLSLLQHTGLVSVQLQKPGQGDTTE